MISCIRPAAPPLSETASGLPRGRAISTTCEARHLRCRLACASSSLAEQNVLGRRDFLQIGYKALSDEKSGGNPLMTDDEYRSEYSIFCLLAAPLIMSNSLEPELWTGAMAATLLNPEMIALDQDPLAISGRLAARDAFSSLL